MCVCENRKVKQMMKLLTHFEICAPKNKAINFSGEKIGPVFKKLFFFSSLFKPPEKNREKKHRKKAKKEKKPIRNTKNVERKKLE